MSSRPLVVVGFGAPTRHTIVPVNVLSHHAGLNGAHPSQYALAPNKLEHHNCTFLVIMNSCIKPMIGVAHESTDSKVCAHYAPGDIIDVPHASQPKSISMRVLLKLFCGTVAMAAALYSAGRQVCTYLLCHFESATFHAHT